MTNRHATRQSPGAGGIFPAAVILLLLGGGGWFWLASRDAEPQDRPGRRSTSGEPAKHTVIAVASRVAVITAAEPAFTITPAGRDNNGLLEGLRAYYTFDRNLVGLDSRGMETRADFERTSIAYAPQLQRAEFMQPRFLAGRFGQGVFVEYGACSVAPLSATNFLPTSIACPDTGGFTAIGNAKLEMEQGRACLGAMLVKAATAEAGAESMEFSAPLTANHFLSFYVRSRKSLLIRVLITAGSQQQILAEHDFTLTDKWQRLFLKYDLKAGNGSPWARTGKRVNTMRLRFVAKIPGEFAIRGLMLENNHGYPGRATPSTWMPANQKRPGETLRICSPINQVAGAVAFWARTMGRMNWRSLMVMDNGNGWYSPLMLEMRRDKTVRLVISPGQGKGKGAIVSTDVKQPGAWHHYAVSWHGADFTLYVDGKPAGILRNAPRVKTLGTIHLGCVATTFSPGLRADAVFDEFCHWDRPLTRAQVRCLAQMSEPLFAAWPQAVLLQDLERVKVFARDDRQRTWRLALLNRGRSTLAGVRVEYGIRGFFKDQRLVGKLQPGEAMRLRLPWSPARLLPGEYDFQVGFAAEDFKLKHTFHLLVVPARAPRTNIQIRSWGSGSAELASLGITAATVTGTALGPEAYLVAANTRYGLYTMLRQIIWPQAANREERFLDINGKARAPDFSSGLARVWVKAQARIIGERLRQLPDVRSVIINTEHLSIGQLDFRRSTISAVRNRFGLDLTPWLRIPPGKKWNAILPGGRLSAVAGRVQLPTGRIIPRDLPFYAFHRWWHGRQSGTEVTLNELICGEIAKITPGIKTIIEPILRRPSIRAFAHNRIAQEWFYYPDPKEAISVQERLLAVTRGNGHMKNSAMPQWLLKPGMAAPYKGLPTSHMFREALWLCLARPMGSICYWNLHAALHQGKQQTRKEIDSLLGRNPTWKQVCAKIKTRGEYSSVALWMPELKAEIARMHNQVIHPLGALLPRWKNRCRRIAVWKSFAGELFNLVRWKGRSLLARVIRDLPQPYDIIYDQDFEDNPGCLDDYDVLAVPECPVLYAPARAALKRFIQRKKVVLVDEYWKVNLAGVTRITGSHGAGCNKRLHALEQKLLALYGSPSHPQYIEGMEQAARALEAGNDGFARIVQACGNARADARPSSMSVQVNSLQAQGANYLVVVNDLRKPGPCFGHFGRVRETGVAQTVRLTIDPVMGKVAYRLLSAKRISLKEEGRCLSAGLDLEPAGGAVLIFLPEAIGGITVKAEPNPGASAEKLSATLLGVSGKPVPGLVPVQVTITRPDGRKSSLSHYSVFVRGRWSYEFPLPYKAVGGKYRLRLRELASGVKTKVVW